MSLLGLLATVITGGAFLKGTIQDANFDAQSKKEAIDDERLTWMDSHGNDHLVSTGEKVFRHRGELISVKTGKAIVDFNAERIKTLNARDIQDAKERNKKYAYLKYPEYGNKCYYTELSTMKRYALSGHCGGNGYESFEKIYYLPNETVIRFDKDRLIAITREEYCELGGRSLGTYDHQIFG